MIDITQLLRPLADEVAADLHPYIKVVDLNYCSLEFRLNTAPAKILLVLFIFSDGQIRIDKQLISIYNPKLYSIIRCTLIKKILELSTSNILWACYQLEKGIRATSLFGRIAEKKISRDPWAAIMYAHFHLNDNWPTDEHIGKLAINSILSDPYSSTIREKFTGELNGCS